MFCFKMVYEFLDGFAIVGSARKKRSFRTKLNSVDLGATKKRRNCLTTNIGLCTSLVRTQAAYIRPNSDHKLILQHEGTCSLQKYRRTFASCPILAIALHRHWKQESWLQLSNSLPSHRTQNNRPVFQTKTNACFRYGVNHVADFKRDGSGTTLFAQNPLAAGLICYS